MEKHTNNELVTLREAAQIAKKMNLKGLSAVSLRRLAAQTKIPGAVKIAAPGNDYWMIPESSLIEIVRQPVGRRTIQKTGGAKSGGRPPKVKTAEVLS